MLGILLALLTFFAAVPPVLGDEPAELIRELNDDRRRHGLSPLVEHPALMAAARAQVADMARRGYVDLTAPDGTSTEDWLARAGYRPTGFGAMALSGIPSVWETAGAVLQSDKIAGLLLDPGEVRIGVGYHEGFFVLRDGGQTAYAWSILVARGPPPPVADAVPGLLREINRARARLGAGPVRLNAALNRAAEAHADDMIARGYFAHESPEGGTPFDRILAAGYDYRKAGENLAAGQPSAAETVQAWHDSPGHAQILYDRTFEDVGIGYRLGPLTRDRRAVPHVWVAVFAVR